MTRLLYREMVHVFSCAVKTVNGLDTIDADHSAHLLGPQQ